MPLDQKSPYLPPQANLTDDPRHFQNGQAPVVWRWFVIYCIAMALMYAFVLGFGVLGVFYPEDLSDTGNRNEGLFLAVMMIVICLPLALGYIVVLFLPKNKLGWIAGIVAIGIGMTSACCMPAAIPLLIFWFKDETKAYFRV